QVLQRLPQPFVLIADAARVRQRYVIAHHPARERLVHVPERIAAQIQWRERLGARWRTLAQPRARQPEQQAVGLLHLLRCLTAEIYFFGCAALAFGSSASGSAFSGASTSRRCFCQMSMFSASDSSHVSYAACRSA